MIKISKWVDFFARKFTIKLDRSKPISYSDKKDTSVTTQYFQINFYPPLILLDRLRQVCILNIEMYELTAILEQGDSISNGLTQSDRKCSTNSTSDPAGLYH